MDFQVQGDLTTGQPVDDRQFPQRVAAIEQGGMESSDAGLKFGEICGFGQDHVPKMVGKVRSATIDPDRIGKL